MPRAVHLILLAFVVAAEKSPVFIVDQSDATYAGGLSNQLARNKNDLDASHSPLMTAAGLSTYQSIRPTVCFALHIASAYISVRSANSIIVVEMAVQNSAKFNKRVTDQELSCVIHDKRTQVVLIARSIFSNVSYRVVRCEFDHVSRAFIGADSDHNILPQEAYLISTEYLNQFQKSVANFFNQSMVCSVPLRPIKWFEKPLMFLVGLTQVRSAADRLRDWVTFHLRDYDHLVVYDDNSKDNILEVLRPFHKVGLVTYLNWTHIASFSGVSANRQFLAMQDFMLRFGSQAEVVSQFDDDCFVHVPRENIDQQGQSPSLRETISYLLVNFPHITQFEFKSKWFGACNSSSTAAEDNSYILESSLKEYPVYEKLVWRYDPVGYTIPWVKAGRPKQVMTILSFTKSANIISSRISHFWFTNGPSLIVPHSCVIYNHYKVLSWADHQEKNRHTWIGSFANRTEHVAMNKLLCKVEDTFLSNQTKALQMWGSQPLREMSMSVRTRPWPTAPLSLPSCDFVRKSAQPRHTTKTTKIQPNTVLTTLKTNFSVTDSPLFVYANITEHIQVGTTIDINGSSILMGYSSFNSRNDVDIMILLTESSPNALMSLKAHWICVCITPETRKFVESDILAWKFRATCTLDWEPSNRQFELLPTSVFVVQRSKLSLFKRNYLQDSNQADDYNVSTSDWVYLRLQRIVRPALPTSFLVGVTEVRDVSVRLRDWLLYAFRIGYDHVVIYDESAQEEILHTLHSFYQAGLVTYIQWSVPKSALSLYEHRQLLAMEHFALVFSSQAELISRFDDDCFFTSNSISLSSTPTIGSDAGTLRPLLKYLLASYPLAGQFQARAKWFGACGVDSDEQAHGNSTSVVKVLQSSIAGSPIYEKLVWRYAPSEWNLPWFKDGPAPSVFVALSFTRSAKLLSNVLVSHLWNVDGESIRLPEQCLSFNHYKMLPWEDHLVKNKPTWLGLLVNSTEYTLLNQHLCKVTDTSISQWSSQLKTWSASTMKEIAMIVKSRPWPQVPNQGIVFC